MRRRNCLYAAPSELVLGQLQDHCAWWREAYAGALTADHEERMRTLARLHYGIVSVMPFAELLQPGWEMLNP